MFKRFEEVLGTVPTETLMDLLPPVGWAEVATKQDLAALEQRLDLRFEAMELRFEAMDLRFEAMEARWRGALAETAHQQTRVFVGWMLGGMGTMFGAFVGVMALLT